MAKMVAFLQNEIVWHSQHDCNVQIDVWGAFAAERDAMRSGVLLTYTPMAM